MAKDNKINAGVKIFGKGINKFVNKVLWNTHKEDNIWRMPENFITKEDLKNEMRPIIVTYYDYGWLVKGKAGEKFIQYLANKKSDEPIFEIKGIQTIINS
jgi:hypothetical protein